MSEVEAPKATRYGVTILLQPQEKTIHMDKVKSVTQLLNRLDIRMGTALVIRDGELLTQDRMLRNGDSIIVRTVVSSG